MTARRPTKTARVSALANCQACKWESESRNGLALAARHHDRTGHPTTTEVVTVIWYGAPVPSVSNPANPAVPVSEYGETR
jgi:hypothetical protein